MDCVILSGFPDCLVLSVIFSNFFSPCFKVLLGCGPSENAELSGLPLISASYITISSPGLSTK